MCLYGSHEYFAFTSSQFLGVYEIQFSLYCIRMYLSTTCMQDKNHFMIFFIFISASIGFNMEHSKWLKSSTSITITTGCLSYSTSYQKLFREAMKLKENFSSFYLDIETRREIIQMGIQKHWRLYRRSRPGVNLFHKVKTVISRLRKWYRQSQMNSTCGNTNIITIKLTPQQTHKTSDQLHYGLINFTQLSTKPNQSKLK